MEERLRVGMNSKIASDCAAFLKLNLASLNGCFTRSMLNSVARLESARPSFSCATNPNTPGSVCTPPTRHAWWLSESGREELALRQLVAAQSGLCIRHAQ